MRRRAWILKRTFSSAIPAVRLIYNRHDESVYPFTAHDHDGRICPEQGVVRKGRCIAERLGVRRYRLSVSGPRQAAIVAIHSHVTHENPRILFLHYWGKSFTAELAKTLKAALATQAK